MKRVYLSEYSGEPVPGPPFERGAKMAKYTQNVPGRLVAGLRRVVGRYNADNGAELTVAQWLQLHVLEVAVQDELRAEQQRLTEQAQKDVAAGVLALRDRLTADDEAAEGGKP